MSLILVAETRSDIRVINRKIRSKVTVRVTSVIASKINDLCFGSLGPLAWTVLGQIVDFVDLALDDRLALRLDASCLQIF